MTGKLQMAINQLHFMYFQWKDQIKGLNVKLCALATEFHDWMKVTTNKLENNKLKQPTGFLHPLNALAILLLDKHSTMSPQFTAEFIMCPLFAHVLIYCSCWWCLNCYSIRPRGTMLVNANHFCVRFASGQLCMINHEGHFVVPSDDWCNDNNSKESIFQSSRKCIKCMCMSIHVPCWFRNMFS